MCVGAGGWLGVCGGGAHARRDVWDAHMHRVDAACAPREGAAELQPHARIASNRPPPPQHPPPSAAAGDRARAELGRRATLSAEGGELPRACRPAPTVR